MYVGVDLSHGPQTTGGRISAVAVVASADDVPSRYFKEVYKQQRTEEACENSIENIVHMKEIMVSLIQQYERYRGFPPNAIVIYRDGISEGEFDSVFEAELTATREACTQLSPVYRPYLTYIVVNKRHHTRFFPMNAGSNNVEAGTVVDSHDVTNPVTFDFYLNSQHGALVRWYQLARSRNLFMCVFVGHEPTDTLSCAVWWQQVETGPGATADLRTMLHVCTLYTISLYTIACEICRLAGFPCHLLSGKRWRVSYVNLLLITIKDLLDIIALGYRRKLMEIRMYPIPLWVKGSFWAPNWSQNVPFLFECRLILSTHSVCTFYNCN